MESNIKRILRDIKDIKNNEEELKASFNLHLDDDVHPSSFNVSIGGPVGTPYEGGTFALHVTCPDRYPHVPLQIVFQTRIWHPNVDSKYGHICLDVLKSKWRPSMNLRIALISIHCLLSSPVPDNPQNAECGRQMMDDPAMSDATSLMWTYIFASCPKCNKRMFQMIRTLESLGVGISDEERLIALSKHNWDASLVASMHFDGNIDFDNDFDIPELILT